MTNRTQFFIIFLLSIFAYQHAFSQDDIIRLQNPSFEDLPRAGKAPRGWYDCGFPGESPPDIQPDPTFDVNRAAYDGGTYVGMVVRDNDTWERISQRLSKPIKANQCYSFSLFLCRSPLYWSRSQLTQRVANYVTPSKIIIWGGTKHCGKLERLGESDLVSSYEWVRQDFKFEPRQTHTYILIEAFYKTPVLFPYNGNVLMDNASPIRPISCDEDAIVEVEAPNVHFINPSTPSIKVDERGISVQAQVKNVSPNLNITFAVNGRPYEDFSFNPDTGLFQADLQKLRKGENEIRILASNEGGNSQDRATLIYEERPPAVADVPVNVPPSYNKPQPTTKPRPSTQSTPQPPSKPTRRIDKDKSIEGVSRRNMKAGQTIQLSKLYFKINESTINEESHEALDEIYDFLKYNEDVAIEIGGHTNGNCDDEYCDSLSEIRAKAVAEYLIQKGIDMKRLEYKGYGKRKPIASNRTAEGRKKNQRVEIKILSMNG